jgi:hypothetical protein
MLFSLVLRLDLIYQFQIICKDMDQDLPDDWDGLIFLKHLK